MRLISDLISRIRKVIRTKRQYWSWHLSAIFYSRTYDKLAHQLDDDLFSYLGNRVRGAVVADCGCGPGVVTEKFLRCGAARVFAIDVNEPMLDQLRSRLTKAIDSKRVIPIHREFSTRIFSDLLKRHQTSNGFDVILFKRSLYAKREQTLSILRAAVASLNQGGVLAVIHGERSLRNYAFGPELKPTHYTTYNLFNRFTSKLGEKLGIGNYNLYTRDGLLNLLREAAPGLRTEVIPSKQRAYNLAAILFRKNPRKN